MVVARPKAWTETAGGDFHRGQFPRALTNVNSAPVVSHFNAHPVNHPVLERRPIEMKQAKEKRPTQWVKTIMHGRSPV